MQNDKPAAETTVDRLAKLAWVTWASSGDNPDHYGPKWDAGSERWKDDWRRVARALVQEIKNG